MHETLSTDSSVANVRRRFSTLWPTSVTRELFAMVAGSVVGLLVTSWAMQESEQIDFEALALGAAQSPEPPRIDGYALHCDGFATAQDDLDGKAIRSIDECITGAKQRDAERVVAWLGNSQVHAVNQLQPGQVTAVGPIHQRLAKHGLDFITVSYPNANQQEHLATYAYLYARLPLAAVVLTLVFDDFRETGVRDRLREELADTGAKAVLSMSDIGRQLQNEASEGDSPAAQASLGFTSLQERSEAFFTGLLERHSELWAARGQIRGNLFRNLYYLRNGLFGIKPNSKRRMLVGRYARNRAAVEAILDHAQDAGITVFGYIAPLRGDIEPPYDMNEYGRFVGDMRDLFASRGGQFRNFGDLVPGRYWGSKASTDGDGQEEVDFMHFRAHGHALVAEHLSRFVLEAGVAP